MAEATDGTEGAPGAETEADLVAALPPQNRPFIVFRTRKMKTKNQMEQCLVLEFL